MKKLRKRFGWDDLTPGCFDMLRTGHTKAAA
jgi:hypothetical protein